MKSFRKELVVTIPSRRAFVNITRQVEDALAESGIQEGLVLVNPMHITASVFINDDERGLHSDYEKWLEKIAPHAPVNQYRHNDTGEDNEIGRAS
ncbi:MAG: YjbQ family protein, partial [Anaerolineaceae bacterium]|nr:YjbQ family protein [Anaerolineaceae bacterium]